MEELFLGVDVGSISANTVLMDQEGKVLEEHYDRMKGATPKGRQGEDS
jgi:activator of 2-hydroxyglutaryl-CoA dehydratase